MLERELVSALLDSATSEVNPLEWAASMLSQAGVLRHQLSIAERSSACCSGLSALAVIPQIFVSESRQPSTAKAALLDGFASIANS